MNNNDNNDIDKIKRITDPSELFNTWLEPNQKAL